MGVAGGLLAGALIANRMDRRRVRRDVAVASAVSRGPVPPPAPAPSGFGGGGILGGGGLGGGRLGRRGGFGRR